ncbi:Monocarboxylate 2-oxoacid-binding periplasmic protein [Zhongshania aliphaticivorans]|uniref:Monocarboxylate 2-oxoacid-binding periplasmic protein n=1 Tax=Zhongshania aliphaticivorans TaxID=1470434 RepID=A0A5S9Q7I1_9GAMM|nr:TRAP transporter substrate-binding protein [Zhongshania aliphaticivorans]CAA0102849.1 Monocarboxylate 2-oxoacid-binding periplasmic protein [Zhongshania aliphaticivorans]CAA0113867.1 Monocarboxylate 2-oxoacid-binding periplasmic protein [Zhongshania aliphaticivorans]
MNQANKANYTPLLILILIAALVAMSWLYVGERSKDHSTLQQVHNTADRQVFHWKLVTTWPKGFPGLGTAPEKFATMVNKMSEGRLLIKVYGAGELVPALGVFDAVSTGSAQAGHGAAYYWKGKLPSSIFFTAVPFGMNAQEMNGWLYHGGGLELWREAYAPFNLIPMAGGNTGVQMAGWFNKEINSLEDVKGLKMRIPGSGGEVWNRLGGTSVTLPGGELYTSLQTGVIDATEWVAPYNDLAFGFHEVAKYYYYPGWHEPGSTLELIINKQAFEALPEDLKAIVETAARYANADMLDEYTARNNAALRELVDVHQVELRKLPDDVIRGLHKVSDEYLKELGNNDPMTKKVYTSWKKFMDGATDYHHISEQSYINSRDL